PVTSCSPLRSSVRASPVTDVSPIGLSPPSELVPQPVATNRPDASRARPIRVFIFIPPDSFTIACGKTLRRCATGPDGLDGSPGAALGDDRLHTTRVPRPVRPCGS